LTFFFSQNAPITYFIFFFKKKIQKHPYGVVWPPQHISFFFFFFFKKIKYVMRAFWKKNVKVVTLPQFESLGGLSVTFETLEVKVQMDG
jgi:hypothetical protein